MPWPVLTAAPSPHRQHHRLRHLHLPQGRAGALGLRGARALRLGAGGRHHSAGLPVLCGAGRRHPQIRRGLCLRHRDLRGPGRVSAGCLPSSWYLPECRPTGPQILLSSHALHCGVASWSRSCGHLLSRTPQLALSLSGPSSLWLWALGHPGEGASSEPRTEPGNMMLQLHQRLCLSHRPPRGQGEPSQALTQEAGVHPRPSARF